MHQQGRLHPPSFRRSRKTSILAGISVPLGLLLWSLLLASPVSAATTQCGDQGLNSNRYFDGYSATPSASFMNEAYATITGQAALLCSKIGSTDVHPNTYWWVGIQNNSPGNVKGLAQITVCMYSTFDPHNVWSGSKALFTGETQFAGQDQPGKTPVSSNAAHFNSIFELDGSNVVFDHLTFINNPCFPSFYHVTQDPNIPDEHFWIWTDPVVRTKNTCP